MVLQTQNKTYKQSGNANERDGVVAQEKNLFGDEPKAPPRAKRLQQAPEQPCGIAQVRYGATHHKADVRGVQGVHARAPVWAKSSATLGAG